MNIIKKKSIFELLMVLEKLEIRIFAVLGRVSSLVLHCLSKEDLRIVG
jgi:hypothetical protein